MPHVEPVEYFQKSTVMERIVPSHFYKLTSIFISMHLISYQISEVHHDEGCFGTRSLKNEDILSIQCKNYILSPCLIFISVILWIHN